MTWPTGAKKWSSAEINADVKKAREIFKKKRLAEPLEKYLKAFDTIRKANSSLTPKLSRLFADPIDTDLLVSILRDEELIVAFRYLGAPPISKDDLETLSGTGLAWTQVQLDPEKAKAIRNVLKAIVDPRRFPWIKEGREPTKRELDAAVLASTVAASAQRVQTERRTEEREEVQGAVEAVLVKLGYEESGKPPKRIRTLSGDAPRPGKYVTEAVIGEHNADIVVGLGDHRVMAIECKGSNSEINSRKRINKEVAMDAASWISRFGSDNLVPAAVIQGVFNPRYIETAQETPVVFFWTHRLVDLAEFLRECSKSR